nr:hypothetical protein HUO10_005365 [Paraburkholderia busanensis]
MEEIGKGVRYGTAANPTLGDPSESAVSWGAIVAGSVGTAAFSLILLTLGSGLGLASISPWSTPGESAERFGIAAVIWVCVTQILASGLGGFLAGRLRRRWVAIHVDETYFRDTAHGFLSWALATLITAALLASAVSGLFHAGAQAAAADNLAGTPASERGDSTGATKVWPMGYFVDSLFRRPAVSSAPIQDDRLRSDEVVRIFTNTLATGAPLSPDDSHYVAQLVAKHTGLPPQVAQARVDTTYSRLQQKLSDLKTAARQAADRARKAAVYTSLWIFVSLLMGAFSASLLATFGGRQRDL